MIYYNLLEDGLVIMIDIYVKNRKEDLTATELQHLKEQKKWTIH